MRRRHRSRKRNDHRGLIRPAKAVSPFHSATAVQRLAPNFEMDCRKIAVVSKAALLPPQTREIILKPAFLFHARLPAFALMNRTIFMTTVFMMAASILAATEVRIID